MHFDRRRGRIETRKEILPVVRGMCATAAAVAAARVTIKPVLKFVRMLADDELMMINVHNRNHASQCNESRLLTRWSVSRQTVDVCGRLRMRRMHVVGPSLAMG